jgi:hypothetical protein
MYLLPKVHKLTPEELNSAETNGLKSLKKTLPGRPIIAQCGTPTYYVGKYIDTILLPYVKNLDTYIQDTPEFIRLIENTKVEAHAKLVAYDCTSMYTNMNIDELVEAVNCTLPETVTHPHFNAIGDKTVILRLLELILRNNHFTFQDKLYTQVVGAAMGSTVSPEICDLRLHQHMGGIIRDSNLSKNLAIHVRYRDDGFMIFNQITNDEINKFFETANAAHPLLKFTHSISDQEMTFLDTEVYKGPRLTKSGILDIRSHTKPTETYQFLHRTSSHPQGVFTGFMKGRMITFIRNNSEQTNLEKNNQNVQREATTTWLQQRRD